MYYFLFHYYYLQIPDIKDKLYRLYRFHLYSYNITIVFHNIQKISIKYLDRDNLKDMNSEPQHSLQSDDFLE